VVVVTMMTKPGFTDALRAFESVYAHITKRDQANIVHIESLLFNLKWKGATKQMINDLLCMFFDLVNKYWQI
jgi:ssDNA-specific exonuclease RecJ